jgi:hypothetical protein
LGVLVYNTARVPWLLDAESGKLIDAQASWGPLSILATICFASSVRKLIEVTVMAGLGKTFVMVAAMFAIIVAVAKPFIAWAHHRHLTGDQWFDAGYLAALGVILLIRNFQRDGARSAGL